MGIGQSKRRQVYKWGGLALQMCEEVSVDWNEVTGRLLGLNCMNQVVLSSF